MSETNPVYETAGGERPRHKHAALIADLKAKADRLQAADIEYQCAIFEIVKLAKASNAPLEAALAATAPSVHGRSAYSHFGGWCRRAAAWLELQ